MSKVFYCAFWRSHQKAIIKVTHEYIKNFIEKGINIDDYSNENILLMINHINDTSIIVYYIFII